MTTFYKKVGRRYIPISEYDSEYLSSYGVGFTLVHCKPGSKSKSMIIEPALAPMIAAGKLASEEIVTELVRASSLRPNTRKPLTDRQREIWQMLIDEMGDEGRTLYGASIHEAVEKGIEVMENEAKKLLENPAVKNAYDQFMMICELTKSESSDV